MDINRALEILNKNHHNTAEWSKWKWRRYRDCGYIDGVAMTRNTRRRYAYDSDLVDLDQNVLSDFEAIAIAEKYQRGDRPAVE